MVGGHVPQKPEMVNTPPTPSSLDPDRVKRLERIGWINEGKYLNGKPFDEWEGYR
jgi:hypothetical protein